MGEIRTVEGEAAAYFDQMSRYFLSRAKTVAKVAKYPHVVRIVYENQSLLVCSMSCFCQTGRL